MTTHNLKHYFLSVDFIFHVPRDILTNKFHIKESNKIPRLLQLLQISADPGSPFANKTLKQINFGPGPWIDLRIHHQLNLHSCRRPCHISKLFSIYTCKLSKKNYFQSSRSSISNSDPSVSISL